MQITIVGSGTVVPHPERVCSAYFVQRGELRILFDCGAGTLHHLARFGLPWSGLSHVAITHFHPDHIGEVPQLLFSLKYGLPQPRREPLTLIGPTGLRRLLERMAAAFGDFILDPGFPLAIEELERDGELAIAEQVRLRAHPTSHTPESVGYRLEAPDGVLGYTGDTGFDDRLGTFFAGVDLLVAECSVPDELAMDNHLSPGQLGALARAARPGRLVVTHVYPQLDREDVPALIRQAGWTGPTQRAADGLTLTVRP